MKKLMVVITVIACLFTSCATTMQQDVFQTSDLNKELMEEVSIFEDRYILIDSEYLLTGTFDSSKIAAFHTLSYGRKDKESSRVLYFCKIN